MTSVLITGATGFIGRSLTRKLCLRGHQVSGVSKAGGLVNNVSVDAVDCSDPEAIIEYSGSKSFDCVIHLAASVPSSFYNEAARQSIVQNVKMAVNLLEASRKQDGGIFIYASGTSVYGYPEKLPATEETPAHPDGFYPLGKFFGELLCQQYQKAYSMRVAILRISAPYGPGMHTETVIKKFIKKAILSEDIPLYGTGSRSQDFTYIEDVVNAIVLAFEARATGIFNVCSGTSTSMQQLAEIILSIVPESRSKITYTDVDDPQENYHAAFSLEKARKSFAYRPEFSLEEGIRRYTEAIKEELRT